MKAASSSGGARGKGLLDTRDLSEIAAIELLRRERAATPLPLDRINVGGPDMLTGAAAAALLSRLRRRDRGELTG